MSASIRYLSVCSGIEAASAAWMPLGWRPVAFSEIEPFPARVLAHHHPGVPNWGDMTKYEEWPDEPIDLLCGGTPCQSFSVAGLRKGLDDPRGNLMLTFGAIAARYRPRWLVWENVPGVLSSNGGRDFGTFLGLLAELGYGFAYRVLDAQYVRVESHPRAVPQRRRRVFVVGHSGAQWQRAAAVLFERESLCGHPAPRREAGQGVAACLTRGAESSGKGGYAGRRREDDVNLVAHALRGEGFDASEDGTGRGTPLVPAIVGQAMSSKWAKGSAGPAGDEHHNLIPVPTAFPGRMSGTQHASTENVSPALGALNPTAVAYSTKLHNTTSNQAGKVYQEYTASLDNSSPPPALLTSTAVRRLTPLECERLQGFPDGHTRVPHKGKDSADGPRYKALGNSWAINAARWIGERIASVDCIAAGDAA
ncbi:MAG: DNA cytosine methyltransferase [Ottowia sp.]|nr:DNA cytosine methyltransferase [Ottowia sp.]